MDVVFASDYGGTTESVVYGGPGADLLFAGEAGSRLIGGLGHDRLIGGAGRDMISEGGGKDTIRGDLRSDGLRGGPGADTFYARDGYRDRVFGGKGVTALASTAGSTVCAQSRDFSELVFPEREALLRRGNTKATSPAEID